MDRKNRPGLKRILLGFASVFFSTLAGAPAVAHAQLEQISAHTYRIVLSGDHFAVQPTAAVFVDEPFIGPALPPREGFRIEFYGDEGNFIYSVPLDPGQIDFSLDEETEFGDIALSPTFDRVVAIPDLSDIAASIKVIWPVDPFDPFDPIEWDELVAPEFYDILKELILVQPVFPPYIHTHYGSAVHKDYRYNIVVLGEGYSDVEYSKFMEDVDRWVAHLFSTIPFSTYSNHFNVFSVFRPGSMPEPPLVVFPGDPTPTGPYYWQYGQHTNRCASVRNYGLLLRDALLAPALTERPIVFINTDEHVGCARTDYLTSGTEPEDGPPVATHELGHMFGLGDEYVEPDEDGGGPIFGLGSANSGTTDATSSIIFPPPCAPFDANYDFKQPNLTADPSCNKWSHWHGDEGVACFAGAGGVRGSEHCAFRPKQTCTMRVSTEPFCPVCREALILHLRSHVPPLRSVSGPEVAGIKLRHEVTTNLATPYCSAEITWSVDGAVKASNVARFYTNAADNYNEVQVTVEDQCHFVRHDPLGLMMSEHVFEHPNP